MQLKLFLIISLVATVLGLGAQDFTSVDTHFEQSRKEKFYHLDADTLLQPAKSAADILKSADPLEKSGFLFNLNTGTKSSFATYWKLDSIVTTEWDVQNQTIKPSQWQVFNTLEDQHRFEIRNYSMDENKGHWTISEAQYYNLNENGLLDSAEFQTHVTLNYILYQKYLYTYENGRLQAEVSLEKFDDFEDWKYSERYDYQYDSQNRLERVFTQEKDPFNSNLWRSYKYVKYTYDSLNNIVFETYFDYDDYDMVSTKTAELAYSYDEQNRLKLIVEFVEGWQAGTFVEEAKQENFYDDENRLVQVVISHWDYDVNDWKGYMRNTQKFDLGTDTLMVLETEHWDSSWILRDRSVFEAPNSIQKNTIQSAEFIFSFLPAYELDGVVCEKIHNYELDSTAWQDRGVTTYFFSETDPVEVPTVFSPSIKIYPNPVADYLFVECLSSQENELAIHNLNGQLLLYKNLAGKERINVQAFPSGIYFIEIRRNGIRTFSDKFIKK